MKKLCSLCLALALCLCGCASAPTAPTEPISDGKDTAVPNTAPEPPVSVSIDPEPLLRPWVSGIWEDGSYYVTSYEHNSENNGPYRVDRYDSDLLFQETTTGDSWDELPLPQSFVHIDHKNRRFFTPGKQFDLPDVVGERMALTPDGSAFLFADPEKSTLTVCADPTDLTDCQKYAMDGLVDIQPINNGFACLTLLDGAHQNTTVLWNIVKGSPRAELSGAYEVVPFGEKFVLRTVPSLVLEEQPIYSFDPSNGAVEELPIFNEQHKWSIRFSENGLWAIAGETTGEVTIYDTTDFSVKMSALVPGFDPEKNRDLCTISNDGTCMLAYDTAYGDANTMMKLNAHPVE